MPGLAQQRNDRQFGNATAAAAESLYSFSGSNGSAIMANGFWSKHRDDVSYNQLQKVLQFDGFCLILLYLQ